MKVIRIVRETRDKCNIHELGCYERTVVYAVQRYWLGTKRTALFTYIRQQQFREPEYFHPLPWTDTADCLEYCQRGQFVGYKLNFWRIMRFKWLDQKLYNELKRKAA